MGIRFLSSLIGIALGLLVAAAALEKFSLSASALIVATLIFWLVHMVVQLLALRVLVRQPSVALAGLLALGATIVSLFIVQAVVSGLTIRGPETYALATLIVWLATAIADTVGSRMVRASRER
jgi:hypothetical protein